jgi:NB-ARC domain
VTKYLKKLSAALQPAARHFTGRKADVDWLIRKLLKAGSGTHISLVGPGGAGKTAIAREAMEQVAHAFPGGIFMHDFYAAPSLAAFQDSILGRYREVAKSDSREDITHNILCSERALVYAEGVEKLLCGVRERSIRPDDEQLLYD